MPKVAHVITRMILGGAQENTLLTVEGFNRRPGWETVLITGPAIGPEGELIARARRNGVRVIMVDAMRRAIHPLRDLASYSALKSILREERPDVVHTHSSKAGILGRAAARAVRTPIVVHTIHGMAFHANQGRLTNALFVALEKMAARWTDSIITVCDTMADQAVAAGVAPREKFATVYSGMEVDDFLDASRHRDAARQRLGVPPGAPVIGKVARLFELKGHEYLIDAMPAVLARFPDARFLFVGDGILRDTLVARARNIGVPERALILAGLVESHEVPAMISAMDLLVHCSLREGLARVLPQALLAGVPVISYDVDGAREVVIDGRTGWLLPPREVSGLAGAIVAALSDPAGSRRRAEAGRSLCAERFRAEKMVDDIEAIYRRLLARGTAAAPARAACCSPSSAGAAGTAAVASPCCSSSDAPSASGSGCCSSGAAACCGSATSQAAHGVPADPRELVREAYAKVARQGSSCCDSGTCAPDASFIVGDHPVPESELGLSCGNPLAFGHIRAGDVVVDLGSGAGKDVFLAAERVGREGRAIGVDMTPDMLDLARRNAVKFAAVSGLENVEFRQGTIESLPVDDASADVVISNCVINLSPDKPRVFREVSRVLKPGGRMIVSDIVLSRPLPQWALDSADLYASCIAGALLRDDYLRAIADAGLEEVEILSDSVYQAGQACCDPVTAGAAETLERVAASITVLARRPLP